MSNSKIGLYAVPKTGKNVGKVMVAVDYNETSVKLLDVHSNRKITLKRSNVRVFMHNGKSFQCRKTTLNGSDYLVTLKGLIISMKTYRVMQWSDNDTIACAIKTKAYLEAN